MKLDKRFVLTDENRSEIQWNKLCSVLTKMDRVLVESAVTVKALDDVNGYIQAPSYTDGSEIVLNKRMLDKELTDENIVRLFGLNYHEVAHVLYSPMSARGKFHSKLTFAAEAQGYNGGAVRQTWNYIEDQRIERLLIARWPSTELYFVAAISEYLIAAGKSESQETLYALLCSRGYLDADIRSHFKSLMVTATSADVVAKVEALIGEYSRLVITADTTRAISIIVEVHGIMAASGLNTPEGRGHGDGVTATSAEPSKVQNQKTDQKLAAAESGDPVDGESAGEAEASDGSATGSGVAGKLKSIYDAVLESESMQAEISNHREHINSLKKYDPKFNRVQPGSLAARERGYNNFTTVPVPSSYQQAAKRMTREFRRLVTDLDPGWNTHRPSGRVNVQRAMHGAALDEMFDVWDSGVNDACDIEAVIYGDRSGSMAQEAGAMSASVWATKRALDQIGARATVLSYNQGYQYVYTAEQKVQPTTHSFISAGGSTVPLDGFERGNMILAASSAKQKVVFIQTDGAWADSYACDQMIASWNAAGVTTVLCHLDASDSPYKVSHHECQVFKKITSAEDMTPMVTDVIKAIIRNQRKGRR